MKGTAVKLKTLN
ncbi:hypothetical protein cypCar_00002118 [Cyprinus carpio]|nr:hypothetical protein cypCar_00002118 [Cyprinus carpio]